jgi:drug/metabolite transporter (DMT)-like permease
MVPYWIIIVLLACALHGLANILDNYFINRLFKNPAVLVFLAPAFGLMALPFIFAFTRPGFPPISLLPFIIIVGLTDVLYLYPYYKALQTADTSIVTALFSLGKIFVPVMAFFLVGERLDLLQYAGFFVIVVSAAFLTMDDYRKLKFNRSFLWMLLCSLILAFETVVYKYIFNNTAWATGFSWAVIFSFLLVLPMLFIKKYRSQIGSSMGKARRSLHLFVMENILALAGTAGFTFAISVASVTLVSGIGSLQSVFVILYAVLFARLYPGVFKEKVTKAAVAVKLASFAAIAIGVILTLI